MRPPSRPKKPRSLASQQPSEPRERPASGPDVERGVVPEREASERVVGHSVVRAHQRARVVSSAHNSAIAEPSAHASLHGVAEAGELVVDEGATGVSVVGRVRQMFDRLRHPRGDELSLRRAERRRERHRSRARKLAIWAGAAAVVVALVWVVFGSSLFRYQYSASDVSISGNAGPLKIDKLRASVKKQLDGTLLLTLDVSNAEKTVLEALPEAASVNIDRHLPRTLAISATPARPVACLGTGAQCDAVSENGRVMELDAKAKGALPKLVAAGEGSKATNNTKIGIATLASVPTKLLAQVQQIDVSEAGLISLTLQGKTRVYWGDDTEPKLKGKIVMSLAGTGASLIDVSSPSSPVTK
ncbi:cell division protein FtsQ [Arcanobacterium wilhelmae]|uniref:Cell division protein FtsQ n=1 Tax=Arcanobacterium wilhelmae TaxID=1803177 RepID=A0ABT9N958_9ACTO|nr:cell division protein FtsQ/DivIB [Arcanobacterium wilhelmae]MDP9800247.1 cell division protein FtsQ [Arcanobacterium wilhelmae]WFN89686.1 cell division protein FtsQ/DivIB [Arcanobacterium wilhelmae]